jgi:hypothetical protein
MSQAEALLNRAAMTGMYTSTPETEPHIVIGPDRNITVPNELKRLAVQFDHNIETVVFDCPRYWDDADMSEMSVYINYKRNDKYIGSFMAENVVVDEIDQSMIHFDWRISKNVTMVSGPLQFLVCIKKTTEGEEETHWNSEICDDCYISEGMEYGEVLQDTYPDVLAQLQKDNQESMAAVKQELLDAKANGEFNPVISIESITGGYRVHILVGAEEQHIDLMHGSTPVIQSLVEAFLQIKNERPTSGPALWLDSEDGESGTLYFINKSGVTTPIYPTTKLDNVDGLEDLIAHMESKENPHGVTAAQIGAAPNMSFVLDSPDGREFIGAIPGPINIVVGTTFVVKTERVSATATPTLNINGLGTYPLRRRVAGYNGGYADGHKADWITPGVPFRVMFTGDMWLADMAQVDISDANGVLSPEHGGTGTDNWEANGLVYAMAMNRLGQVSAATQNGSVLMQDNNGGPHWASLSGQIDEFGAVRFKHGSYTGQGNAGNRDLGVTPKLLFIFKPDSAIYPDMAVTPRVFTQGRRHTLNQKGYSPVYQEERPYSTTTTLQGSVLIFSISDYVERQEIQGPYAYEFNGSGVTYEWFAIY